MEEAETGTTAADVLCAIISGASACSGQAAVDNAAACAAVPQAMVYQLRAREAADQARLEQALTVLQRRLVGPDLCSIDATLETDGTLTLEVVSLAADGSLDPTLLKPGVVAFYAVDDTRSPSEIAPGYAVLPDLTGAPVMLRWEPLLPSAPVAHAEAVTGAIGWAVLVELTEEASAAFATVSAEHLDQRLAITVDDVVLMAPRLMEPVTGGKVQISGDFTAEEAHRLAAVLDGGPMPEGVTLELISVEATNVR